MPAQVVPLPPAPPAPTPFSARTARGVPLPDLRRSEIQEILGIGSAKFYELIHSGDLEAYRVGGPKGALRVTREALERFRARNRVQPKPKECA